MFFHKAKNSKNDLRFRFFLQVSIGKEKNGKYNLVYFRTKITTSHLRFIQIRLKKQILTRRVQIPLY